MKTKWVNGELVEVEQTGPADTTPEATRGGPTEWEPIEGGIEFDNPLTIFASDDAPVLRVAIEKVPGLEPPPGQAYRLLVKRFPDSSIKYLLIDLTHPEE